MNILGALKVGLSPEMTVKSNRCFPSIVKANAIKF